MKIVQNHRKSIIWAALLTLLPFAAIGVLLLAKACYARWILPYMPPCLLRTFTGYLCPSCGMTHAVFALCRGDVWAALRENAVIPFAMLLAVFWYVEQWIRFGGSAKKIIPRSGKFWVAVLGMWMLYAVLRNLW